MKINTEEIDCEQIVYCDGALQMVVYSGAI